jgi:hypothetical protein
MQGVGSLKFGRFLCFKSASGVSGLIDRRLLGRFHFRQTSSVLVTMVLTSCNMQNGKYFVHFGVHKMGRKADLATDRSFKISTCHAFFVRLSRRIKVSDAGIARYPHLWWVLDSFMPPNGDIYTTHLRRHINSFLVYATWDLNVGGACRLVLPLPCGFIKVVLAIKPFDINLCSMNHRRLWVGS